MDVDTPGQVEAALDGSGDVERHLDARHVLTLLGYIGIQVVLNDCASRARGNTRPAPLTDLPSADVTLFLPNRQKKVSDYFGCTWAPFILRSLEKVIDEQAGTRRWVH